MLAFFLCILVGIFGFLESKMGLYEVTLVDENQLKDFIDLAGKLKLDLWKHPSVGQPARFSTNSDPEHIKYIKSHLVELRLDLRVVNEDLDGTIKKEMRDNAVKRAHSQFKAAGAGGIETYFASYKDYNNWMHSLTLENPKMISLIDIGKSFEGREMKVLKISTGEKKETLLMESGTHAREWLGISSLVWIINKIIVGYKNNDADAKKILDRFDIYVLPVLNPDGYELTRKGGKNRLWRKNTMPVNNGCYGVDLNRNYDADFGRSGVSNNPCEVIYPGPKPFSAPETRNFRDFFLTIKNKIKLFLSFHAFSQLLLTPWAYTKSPPNDNQEMMRVANLMAEAIYKTHGTRFQVGSPANILYEASGGCYDWVKKNGVKYAYTFEVRPDGNNRLGFVAPVEWIIPAGEELYQAVVIALKSVK